MTFSVRREHKFFELIRNLKLWFYINIRIITNIVIVLIVTFSVRFRPFIESLRGVPFFWKGTPLFGLFSFAYFLLTELACKSLKKINKICNYFVGIALKSAHYLRNNVGDCFVSTAEKSSDKAINAVIVAAGINSFN